MAKQAAPVSLTGGDGFNYEDRVAARFLVDMLSGIVPFGVEFGCVTRVDWQVRDTGRLLDDLGITMSSMTGVHVAELSIKSHRQVTSNGFPAKFVEAAWEEWFHSVTTAFQQDRDLIVLVTGKLANDVHESWSTLLREARATTPDRLISRLQPPITPNSGSQASETARTLFESFHCPVSLRARGMSGTTVSVELIRRVRLLHLDFDSEPSRDLARAVADCRTLLKTGDLAEGQRLWEAIVAVAAENRGLGGSLDCPTLLAKLRPSFEIVGHADYRSDWLTLERASNDVLDDVRTEIGGGSTIDRDQELQQLASSLEAIGICLAAGESGCGKSALAKSLASTNYDSVVALLPEDFEFERLQHLEARLGITHPLTELFGASRDRCLLLLDSMERFSERGLRLAGRMIAGLLADNRCDHVHVLLLMQYDAAQRVIARLGEAGVEQPKLNITPIDNPPESAIRNLLRDARGVPWATLHRDMRPLLRNLKILDWVVRAAQSGSDLGEFQVTGLISLIDYLWSRWIESDDRGIAGSGLLKKLAVIEASTLASGVPLTSLEHTEQQALTSLLSAELVRRRNERIRFSHDLLGDWARLKVLIGEDPTRSSEGLRRCGMARWHRAVRLFGRWLLAQNDGVRRWSEALDRAENGTDEGTVVRDLLMESVVVSENSHSLLSLAWPVLVESEGRRLKLLLDRFMFVATIPDLRLPKLVKTGAVAPQVEIAFRIPVWPYWGAILTMLESHLDEICRLVPGETARICKLWLEKTPVEVAPDTAFPWRDKAAKVALGVAREFQARQAENQYLEESEEKLSYEAALLAAHEFPDDVVAFALEMAKRRPQSPKIQERADTARIEAEAKRHQWEEEHPERVQQLRELGEPLLPLGELIGPWPDGPAEHVEPAFRKAVLDSTAVISLAEVQPDVALEVLLAACIEPPYHENPFGSESMDDCGLVSSCEHQPAMYFRGPFLQFIRLCPTHGTEFVLRLINFASMRWVALEDRRRQRRGKMSSELTGLIEEDDTLALTVQVANQTKTWRGDRRVYRWHLDWPIDCRIIPCVLMALEKWLYEQIDDGSDIDLRLQQLMDRSESVAFAGLLINIGKREPRLFLNSLRPLLGVSTFYLWEPRILMERSSTPLGLMGWWNQPRDLVDLAKEWHGAPHRKHELPRIAAWWMIHSSDMEAYFSECREHWRNEHEASPMAHDLRMLIELLDRRNYIETPVDDNKVRFDFVLPESLFQQARQDGQRADDSMRLLTIPMDCRRILDGEKKLPPEDRSSFWDMVRQIADQDVKDGDEGARKAAAVSGAVAVLLNLHSDWIESDADRTRWCFEQLQQIIQNPPPRREFDVPESAGDWNWDCFVAEAGVGLLKSTPDSPFVRGLVAFGIAGYHYGTTQKTMTLAHRLRKSLSDRFDSMLQLAIRWSFVRRLRSQSGYYLSEVERWQQADNPDAKLTEMYQQLETEAERWREEHNRIIDQFVNGETEPTTLHEAGQKGYQEVEHLANIRFPARKAGSTRSSQGSSYRRHHRVRRKDLGIDCKVIHAAYAWLDVSQAESAMERRQLLGHVSELLELVLISIETVDEGDEQESGELPGEFDGWVFGHVSQAIAQMRDDEQPSSLWEPILSLGSHAREWIQRFFWYWFSEGFQASTDHNRFAKRWSEMLEFALASPLWDSQQNIESELDEAVFELMGYNHGLHSIAAESSFAMFIEGMIPLYEVAAQRWFRMPRVANGFARSLAEPGYDRLLCPGIRWIHRAMTEANDYEFWGEHEIESNLISALHRCWERHSESVCADRDLQSAFLGILMALASRGNHAAMALRERLLDSISETE